jgi:hypothetical protein
MAMFTFRGPESVITCTPWPAARNARTSWRRNVAPRCMAAFAKGAHHFQWIEYMRAFRKPETSHGAGSRRVANGFQEFSRCRLRWHEQFGHGARLLARATLAIAAQPDLIVAMLADQVRRPISPSIPTSAGTAGRTKGARCRVFSARWKAARAKRIAQGRNFTRRREGMSSTPPNAEQLAPEPEQQLWRGQGLEQFGGDVPGVAETCAAFPRWSTVDEQHASPVARQRAGNGAADDARADDRNRVLLRHSATVYDLRPR